jgi:quercetin dioxygenase-like cupin family protein
VGSVYDWHTAPTTQYVICLTGTLEFEMYSGKTFTLHPGEVLIALDTTGSGHAWKIVGNDPWKRAYVTFHKETEPNFFKSKSNNM